MPLTLLSLLNLNYKYTNFNNGLIWTVYYNYFGGSSFMNTGNGTPGTGSTAVTIAPINTTWGSNVNPAISKNTGVVTDFTDLTSSTNSIMVTNSTSHQFCVEWLGYFKPTSSGTWTFSTSSDDASYLWLDTDTTSYASNGFMPSNAIINNSGDHPVQKVTGTVSLTGGKYYYMRIQYGENGGGYDMQVTTTPPSGTETNNLYGYVFNTNKYNSGLIWRVYYNYFGGSSFMNTGNGTPGAGSTNVTLAPLNTNSWGSANNALITKNTGFITDFTNLTSATNSIITANGATHSFCVEWLGYFKPTISGTWTFSTNSDDASYLWLDTNTTSYATSGFMPSNAIVNNGTDHGMTKKTGTASLTGGKYYYMRIQYGENGGGYDMQVTITPPGGTETYNLNGYVFNDAKLISINSSIDFVNNYGGSAVSYLNVNSTNLLRAGISWSCDCWIKSRYYNAYTGQGIFSWGNTSIGLYLNYSGAMEIQDLANYYNSKYTDNQWHHVCVTSQKGVALKWYIDGVLVNTYNSSLITTSIGTGFNFSIGSRDYGGSAQNYIGKVAECRYWENVVLTDNQVLLHSQLYPPQVTLTLRYSFNGTAGSNISNGAVITNNNGSKVANATAVMNSANPVFYSADTPTNPNIIKYSFLCNTLTGATTSGTVSTTTIAGIQCISLSGNPSYFYMNTGLYSFNNRSLFFSIYISASAIFQIFFGCNLSGSGNILYGNLTNNTINGFVGSTAWGTQTSSSNTLTWTTGKWLNYEIRVTSGQAKLYLNTGIVLLATYTIANSGGYIGFGTYSTPNIYISNVYVT